VNWKSLKRFGSPSLRVSSVCVCATKNSFGNRFQALTGTSNPFTLYVHKNGDPALAFYLFECHVRKAPVASSPSRPISDVVQIGHIVLDCFLSKQLND
jgi:hypothetical protein